MICGPPGLPFLGPKDSLQKARNGHIRVHLRPIQAETRRRDLNGGQIRRLGALQLLDIGGAEPQLQSRIQFHDNLAPAAIIARRGLAVDPAKGLMRQTTPDCLSPAAVAN
jgi:hypothetical protein